MLVHNFVPPCRFSRSARSSSRFEDSAFLSQDRHASGSRVGRQCDTCGEQSMYRDEEKFAPGPQPRTTEQLLAVGTLQTRRFTGSAILSESARFRLEGWKAVRDVREDSRWAATLKDHWSSAPGLRAVSRDRHAPGSRFDGSAVFLRIGTLQA